MRKEVEDGVKKIYKSSAKVERILYYEKKMKEFKKKKDNPEQFILDILLGKK